MQIVNSFPFTGFLLILLLLSIKIRHLKRKGIRVERGKKNSVKSIPIYFFFGLIFIIWLFEIIKPVFRLSISILPEVITGLLIQSNFMKISGATLLLISLILWSITLFHFKTSLRFGLNENNQGKLITTGIFSISRNPFFLSLDLFFLGIALFLPNLFYIGFAVLSIVCIHFFILKEEKFMQMVYGKEYKNYVRKVRRYI